MTGRPEDGPDWQKHIGNRKQRRDVAEIAGQAWVA